MLIIQLTCPNLCATIYEIHVRDPLIILPCYEKVYACLEMNEKDQEENQLQQFENGFTRSRHIKLLNKPTNSRNSDQLEHTKS